jgi:hypothetical protein
MYSISGKLNVILNLHLWRTYDHSRDVNRARENIRDSIKTSAKESIGQYEQKQAKPQGLQDPTQIAALNVNNVRCETSTISGRVKKKKEGIFEK